MPSELAINIEKPAAQGGGMMNMSLDENLTGNMLKQRVMYTYGKQAQEQTLWFQNPDGDWKLTLVEDLKTLKTMGIAPGATIKEGKELGYRKPEESELRRNIQQNNDMSYYYAHAKETPLPDSLRFVSGGDPIPLNGTGIWGASGPASAWEGTVGTPLGLGEGETGSGSPAVKKTIPQTTITKFSWCDSDDYVKIYITQDEVMKVLNENCKSEEQKKQSVWVAYVSQGMTVNVYEYRDGDFEKKDVKRHYVLKISSLQHDIEPEKCKAVKFSGSKITVTLKKKNVNTKWYSLHN